MIAPRVVSSASINSESDVAQRYRNVSRHRKEVEWWEDVDELEKAWSTWLCFGTNLHLDLVVLWGTSKASKAPFTFGVTSRRNHNIQLCLLWKLVPVTLSLPCTESLLLPKGATQS
jgi:hypothetical protein